MLSSAIVDADKLTLWRVSIPDNEAIIQPENLSMKKELNSPRRISQACFQRKQMTYRSIGSDVMSICFGSRLDSFGKSIPLIFFWYTAVRRRRPSRDCCIAKTERKQSSDDIGGDEEQPTKTRSYGMVTDAATWVLIECTLHVQDDGA